MHWIFRFFLCHWCTFMILTVCITLSLCRLALCVYKHSIVCCACTRIDGKMLCTHLCNLIYCSLAIQCGRVCVCVIHSHCWPFISLLRELFIVTFRNYARLFVDPALSLLHSLRFVMALFYSLKGNCVCGTGSERGRAVLPGHFSGDDTNISCQARLADAARYYTLQIYDLLL